MPTQRVPLLLWGDLVRNGKPVLRRALAGPDAHECMYAWVYLTDYLALCRLRNALKDRSHLPCDAFFARFDDEAWKLLDRSVIDPRYQLAKEGFHLMACVTALSGASFQRPQIVELGSTFFAARVKFEILDSIARQAASNWPMVDPEWVGIDNSSFMKDVTETLHPGAPIMVLDDYEKFRGDGHAIFLARFVASYVFPDARAFTRFLDVNFSAAVVEDAHSISDRDVPVGNHGQPEVLYSLPDIVSGLRAADFRVYFLSSYPDHPAGAAPCHVVKYLAVKPRVPIDRIAATLAALGFPFDPSAQLVDERLLERLNRSVSPAKWEEVRKAKERTPIWGPTPEPAPKPGLLRALKDRIRRGARLAPWRRYRLAGEQAVEQIYRVVTAIDGRT